MWWYKECYISNIDDYYNDNYFEDENKHILKKEKKIPKILIRYLNKYFKKINTILEVGGGGGWFTREFITLDIDVDVIEGSNSGFNKIKKITDNVIKHDLRKELNLNKKYDLIVCMEVAEHLEPPFASMLVNNLIKHSDIIYFTACGPRKQHKHHPNEQHYRYWINIFQYYGFYKVVKFKKETPRKSGIIFMKEKK